MTVCCFGVGDTLGPPGTPGAAPRPGGGGDIPDGGSGDNFMGVGVAVEGIGAAPI